MPISVMPICTVERKPVGSSPSRMRALGAAVAGLGHGLEPGAPGGDDGELGHGEEAVQKNEHQHDHDGKEHSAPRSRPVPFIGEDGGACTREMGAGPGAGGEAAE